MKPRYIAMAFDVGRETTFRRKLFPSYKAQRKPVPTDLALQVGFTAKSVWLCMYVQVLDRCQQAGHTRRWCCVMIDVPWEDLSRPEAGR